MAMWLAGAKCGCSEEYTQHSLYPSRVFSSPLSRYEHTLWGHFLCLILTGPATSTQIATLLWHWGGLAPRRGRDGVGSVSPILRSSIAKLRRGAQPFWSDFIDIPSSALHPHWEEGTETEGGLGFHSAFNLLQDANQARAQLECELVQETQELAWRYDNKQSKQAMSHERWGAQMVKQKDATFQVVFSQESLADSIKLPPWCISSAVPLCYMSGVKATAMQQDEEVPAASDPEGSPAPGPSSSPAHPLGTPLPPVPPLPNIPLVGTILVGCQFAEFLAISTHEKQDYSSSSSLNDHHNKRTQVDSQEVKARSEHNSEQGDENMPKLVLGIEPALNKYKSRNLPALFQPNQGHHLSWWWYGGRKFEENWWSVLIWLRLIQGGGANSDMDTVSRNYITCSNTDKVTMPPAQSQGSTK